MAAALTAAVLLGPVSPTRAQSTEMRFDHFGTEEGLSLGVIWAVAQDRMGYMWIGTEEGLNRYDGYRFSTYKPVAHDTGSISDIFVLALHEDRTGTLWVGTRDGGLNAFDHRTERFTRYRRDPAVPASLPNDRVNRIVEDSAGTLWVATMGGLARWNPASRDFTTYRHDRQDPRSLPGDHVNALAASRRGGLWVGTESGLGWLDVSTGRFTRYAGMSSSRDPNWDNVLALEEDEQGRVWVGTAAGLTWLDPADGAGGPPWTPSARIGLPGQIAAILENADHEVWVGTRGHGLYMFDAHRKLFVRQSHDPANPSSLSDTAVTTMCQDDDGRLWIGTEHGLNKFDPVRRLVALYRHHPDDPTSLSDNKVAGMVEDREGRVWIATRGGGLDRFHPDTGTFDHFRRDPTRPGSLSHDEVWSVAEARDGGMWVGTTDGVLQRFDPARGQFTRFPVATASNTRAGEVPRAYRVFQITEDATGYLWIGLTMGGLVRFDRQTSTWIVYRHDPDDPASLSSDDVSDVLEDHTGALWVATDGAGLNRFDRGTGRFVRYAHDPKVPGSLSHDAVSDIYEDAAGTLWVATYGGGINRLDRTRDTFDHFTEADGLPNAIVYGIVDGGDGHLLLSTNNGLCRFAPQTRTAVNFDASHGLQGNEFGLKAFMRSRGGTVYFGGFNGFNAFRPEIIRRDPHLPRVVFTDFLIFNESMRLKSADPESPLVRPIGLTTDITLSYRDSVIAFEFAALHFTNPMRNQYAYRLEGFDRGWIRTSASKRFATYTNLPPGRYTLRVKASNNDGVWNDEGAAIAIVIEPPFWQAAWFRVIATAGGLGLFVAFVQIRTQSLRRRRRELEATVAERTRELGEANQRLEGANDELGRTNAAVQQTNHDLGRANDQLASMNERLEQTNRELEQARLEALQGARAKSEFLANMSHEIRTPMNGVLGFANLLAMTPLTADQQECLSTIRSSGDALLTIINDVLDLSKIDVGKIDLEAQPFDARACFEEAIDVVAPRAAEKRLELTCVIDPDLPPGVVGDVTRLRQVLVNLLSNAVKFTETGEVELRVDVADKQPHAVTLDCAVWDTGIGIPADRIDGLFDPFTQADSSMTRRYGGTGLGLTISKALCELMGGRLRVDSRVGAGSTFRFSLTMPVATEIAPRPEDGRVPGFAGVKVLVVDAHATSRRMLEAWLTRWGMTPTVVASATEALALVGGGDRFRVALVDTRIPELDGVRLEQALRARAGGEPGVIAMATVGAVAQGDGFAGRIVKPVKRGRLFEAILRVLSRTSGLALAPPAPAQKAAVESPQSDARSRLAVLLAEDNVVNSMLAVRLLRALGITADVVQTGQEALDAAERRSYDAILMDIHMPVMDGLEATRRIAERCPAGVRPYVIALTASVMEDDVRRCREAGMDDFLPKPISLDGLGEVLDRAARAVALIQAGRTLLRG